MQQNTNYKHLLKELKNKLDKGEMSTLIGAGFSKNVDPSFPDWAELIHEMVHSTESRRIEKEFASRFPKVKLTSQIYKDYLWKEIRSFIDQTGPLKAVSDFIKHKGFREVVDHLIEQSTPVIEVAKGKRYLRSRVAGKIKKKLLSESDVVCHTKLINLPWNNIFTTNYDNLLEQCIDINSKEDVDVMIAELEKKIGKRKIAEKSVSDKIKKEIAGLEKLEQELSIKIKVYGIKSQDVIDLVSKIESLKVIISKLDSQNKFETYFIDRHISRLENLNDIQRNFRTTVIQSSELAIKKNQNIIKIHGSIPAEGSGHFGFDGDVSKNYVISQEDYDSYGEKHEAFMQLMRISLLQESFCLFGFSGVDPNFLGWISWVRDVIQKNFSAAKRKDKIYMIDVWSDEPDPARALFYRNHQIAFIPLGNTSCIEFLEEATGKLVTEDTPKARINLLLDYLSSDNVPGDNVISYEVLKQSEYQSLWEDMPYFNTDSNKLIAFLNKTEQIENLKIFNRIPLLFGNTDAGQQDFLTQFRIWHNAVKHKPTLVANLLKISLLMLQEVFLPVSRIFSQEPDVFNSMLLVSENFPGLYDKFAIIELKDAVWSNDSERFKTLADKLSKSVDKEIVQELNYQAALFAFYNWDFIRLKQILSAWLPTDHWAMKKAGLQSQLSVPDAIQTLRGIEQLTVQETAYKYHILSYLYAANDFRETGEKQYKIVRAIEKGNLRSFDHIIKRLIAGLKKKPKKLIPYGHEKFTITNTIFFGKTTHHRIGIQMLNLWLESAHPVHLTFVKNLSVEEVYQPLKLARYWYPEAVLFFALQYNEASFLIRIAQDLIYTNDIESKIPTIADRMMDAYFNPHTPVKYQVNILVVMSEFINVIEPAIWQPFFLKVWTFEIEKKFLAHDFRVHTQEFLTKGITLLTNPEAAHQIIETLLLQFIAADEKQIKDNVIHFLFQFRENTFLNEIIKGSGLPLKPEIFDELISRLKEDIFFLFVLGNISFSFSQGQVDAVKNTLADMNAFKNTNPRLWRIILIFGDGDLSIEQRVKDAMIKSDDLWRSGIDLTISSYTSFKDFIKLSTLNRYRKGKSLKWTRQEVEILYDRMTAELTKIYHWTKTFEYLIELRDLIKEMKIFLDAEESSLFRREGFEDVKSKVYELYSLDRKSERNIEAVLGDDKSKIIIEIENISDEIYNKNRLLESDFLIEALLYRLLLRKETALPAIMIAITNWFYYNTDQAILKKYKDRLELILRLYQEDTEFEMDEPALEEQLIKLALVLKKWDSDEKLTSPVLEWLNSSRFNSIKYNLKTEITKEKLV
jgi:hypothetical protein